MEIFISLSSDGINKQLISEEDVGPYVVRKELWSVALDPTTAPTEMLSAYTHGGSYIGNASDAEKLYKKYGIIPEKAKPGHSTCSIGKSEKDGKWYGWSHRAIYGFKIGDKIKKGDSGFDPDVGEWTIKTEEDAKRAAKNFAESVSSSSPTKVVKSPVKQRA